MPKNKVARAPSARFVDALVLALILVVAGVTRLTFLDLVEFKDDEAKVAGLAVAFLEGQLLPLVGIVSSVGINNPPAFVYLMTIPIAISRDPGFATGFIGLLGVGGVLLCYRLCDEYFDRRTAQIAALLFAAAPWAVVFSRKMQAQDVVPFFTLLLMGSIFHLARGKGPHHLLGVGLWLNVLVQLHLASVAQIPLVALALVLHWRRLQLRWVAATLALSGALWLPYVIFQLTHQLADVRALYRLLRNPPQIGVEHFRWIVEMAASNAYYGLTGVSFERFRAETLAFDGLYTIEALLISGGLALVVGRLVTTRGTAPGDWRFVLLLLWLSVPPLFFVRHSMPLFPHYFNTVFPVQFILIGLLVSTGERWLTQRFRNAQDQTEMAAGSAAPSRSRVLLAPVALVTWGLVGALVASQVYGFLTLMDFVQRASTLGGHGIPLRDRKEAIDRIEALAAGSTKPVYVASSGQDFPSAFGYLAHRRLTLKIFDDRDTFVVPANDGTPTLYLSSHAQSVAGQLLRERFADRLVDTVWHPGGESGFEIYRLDADARSQLLNRADLKPTPGTLANGMRLIGYELDRPDNAVTAGEAIRLALYWEVAAAPPIGEDYSFFNHLVDDRGQKWGQADGLGYPPLYWRVGDLVVSWFTLESSAEMPAGRGWIETGVYRRQDVSRVEIRAEDGSVADRVRLGPLKLVANTVAPVPPPRHPLNASFGGEIDLIGYDLEGSAAPGATLHLALTWRATKTPTADYTTFVHVVNGDGKLVAQSDGQPGPYPTTLWSPGEQTRDERALTLPEDLPPGTYRLLVGLYRLDTQARLPMQGSDHVVLDTKLVIDGR